MNTTRDFKSLALAIASVTLFSSCNTTGKSHSFSLSGDSHLPVKSVEHGKASWYSVKTNSGTRTASGQRMSDHSATAAHKTLPLGTKVRVINENNGKSEVVTINDRGPFIKGRVIDVTIGIAERLGFAHRGVAPVRLEVLGKLTPLSE